MSTPVERLDRYAETAARVHHVSVDGRTMSVVVVGFKPMLASGVEAFLARSTDLDLRVDDIDVAPDNWVGAPPSVVLVATGSSPLRSGDRLASLVASSPCPVVVLSDLDSDHALFVALRHGACGYLLTEVTAEELVGALRRAAAGQIVVDPTMAGRVMSQLARGTWKANPMLDETELRPRERQVLESLIEGRSNRQIAADLNLGEETIKTYLRSLYRKLGARDRTHAISIVLRRRP